MKLGTHRTTVDVHPLKLGAHKTTVDVHHLLDIHVCFVCPQVQEVDIHLCFVCPQVQQTSGLTKQRWMSLSVW